jgi:hypothetical protein
MTAPSARTSLNAERIRWFAEYLRKHPEWGIFHVSLSDANYEFGASDSIWDDPPYSEAELREVAAWFNRLSPSQRRRLGMKARDLVDTVVRT